MQVSSPTLPQAGRSTPEPAWRRQNRAERAVRNLLGETAAVEVFGSGFERDHQDRPGELFVTVTAASNLRAVAEDLLASVSGLDDAGWSAGWRQLQLGDWMIRLYPERVRT